MPIVHWKTEISAASKRALDLKDVAISKGVVNFEIEEEQGKRWALHFQTVQTWKVTAEEYAGGILDTLPAEGAMFIVAASPWLHELGDRRGLERSKHFIVCCYDEVIEVLAWECEIRAL